jgi:para-nitrobenzyl esterase
MSKRILPLIVLSLFALASSLPAANDIVHLDSGRVSSALPSRDGIRAFTGIPFAAPPVGHLRWRAPQPPAHWKGVRRADTFGPECMQSNGFGHGPFSPKTLQKVSENCLYLNVWTPASSGHQRLPVMVWIYGGGFSGGSSSMQYYDGDALARRGVVVVSFNYRLNVFGFFAYAQQKSTAGDTASGNYGLLDMIAGLKWVQKNIAAFGGDPNRVTIFGESAGSIAVSYLMASPLAKGLFQRVIGESGSSVAGPFVPHTLAQAQQSGLAFAQFAGARSLAQLRALPADRLYKLSVEFVRKKKGLGPFSPDIDGSFLPTAPYHIFAEGKQNDVPLIAGSNAEDGSLFIHLIGPEAFIDQARQRFGSEASAYLKLYPANSVQQAHRSEIESSTDELFAFPMRNWVRLQARTGNSRAYLYVLSHVAPMPDSSRYGAFHGSDIYYVFDSMSYHPNWAWTAADHSLSRAIMSYWVNFAKTGDPNGNGLPHWPAYNRQSQEAIYLGNKIEPKPEPNRARLDWWDEWFAKQRNAPR